MKKNGAQAVQARRLPAVAVEGKAALEPAGKLPALHLIDSPFANIANIARALTRVGAEVERTREPERIATAQKIVLPGVGSFAAAMDWLDANGISDALRRAVANGAYLLGVCVGHQLLFASSNEMGERAGLGIIDGHITRFDTTLPVPQIGWNSVTATSTLFEGVENESFYFVHSYAAKTSRDAIANARYGSEYVAAVQRDRVFGVQFHPEKSSAVGLRVLRNFVGLEVHPERSEGSLRQDSAR